MPNQIVNICASFINIPPISTKISRHVKFMLTDNGRSEGRTSDDPQKMSSITEAKNYKSLDFTLKQCSEAVCTLLLRASSAVTDLRTAGLRAAQPALDQLARGNSGNSHTVSNAHSVIYFRNSRI